jgi:hypothetical protein
MDPDQREWDPRLETLNDSPPHESSVGCSCLRTVPSAFGGGRWEIGEERRGLSALSSPVDGVGGKVRLFKYPIPASNGSSNNATPVLRSPKNCLFRSTIRRPSPKTDVNRAVGSALTSHWVAATVFET